MSNKKPKDIRFYKIFVSGVVVLDGDPDSHFNYFNAEIITNFKVTGQENINLLEVSIKEYFKNITYVTVSYWKRYYRFSRKASLSIRQAKAYEGWNKGIIAKVSWFRGGPNWR